MPTTKNTDKKTKGNTSKSANNKTAGIDGKVSGSVAPVPSARDRAKSTDANRRADSDSNKL